MTSYYDSKNEGLIKLETNKDATPDQIEFLLNKPIYTDIIPNGFFAGSWASVIELTYSPINYPLNDPAIRVDKLDHKTTLSDIIKDLKNRQPKCVWIKGGDPIFKYEDLRWLVERLWKEELHTIIEAPGCSFSTYLDYEEEGDVYQPDLIRLMIPLYKGVVNSPEEYRWFIKHLKDQVNKFTRRIHSFDKYKAEIIFKIDDAQDMEDQIVRAFDFLSDVEKKDRASIIFTLDSSSNTYFPRLRNILSTYLINYPNLKVQPDVRGVR